MSLIGQLRRRDKTVDVGIAARGPARRPVPARRQGARPGAPSDSKHAVSSLQGLTAAAPAAPLPQKELRPPRLRGFTGAKDSRLASGWLVQSESINQNLYDGLGTLRARSRELYLNNDFVRRFVSMVKVNVVGPRGITLQARAKSRRTDLDLDTQANDAIEDAFRDWGRRENCDLTGRCNWVELQLQAITSAAVDGEILARHVMGISGGQYAYKIHHLDPEVLDHKYRADLPNGNKIRLGIETDGDGRCVAYHLRQYTDTTSGYRAASGRTYQRIPANEILHTFTPDHIGQMRGYPWGSSAMFRLKMLDGYLEAAVEAARAGASKMGFIQTADGSSYGGDGTDSNGNVITDMEPGTIEELSDGQTFVGFDPKYPHEQFASFVKTCLQSIAGSMGPGVAYSALSSDLEGVNFSSIRAGVLEEREAWKLVQEWMIGAYHLPIYEKWLRMALLNKKIIVEKLPLNDRDEDRYRRVWWQARRWAWVDPQRDLAASVEAIKNTITTTSAVIRERGDDPDDVFHEAAKERATMARLGVTPVESIGVAGNDAADDGQ